MNTNGDDKIVLSKKPSDKHVRQLKSKAIVLFNKERQLTLAKAMDEAILNNFQYDKCKRYVYDKYREMFQEFEDDPQKIEDYLINLYTKAKNFYIVNNFEQLADLINQHLFIYERIYEFAQKHDNLFLINKVMRNKENLLGLNSKRDVGEVIAFLSAKEEFDINLLSKEEQIELKTLVDVLSNNNTFFEEIDDDDEFLSLEL